MAGWTTPDNAPAIGTPFTQTRWNTYIRDNLIHLHDLVVFYAQNKSGGSVTKGDVVVLLTTADTEFNTTTTVGDSRMVGVVLSGSDGTDNIANDAFGYIILQGQAPAINVTGTPIRGESLQTSATAKKAQAGTTNAFGRSLSAPVSSLVTGFVHNAASTSTPAHVITHEGFARTQRPTLDLQGGLTARDDSGGDRTVVRLSQARAMLGRSF